MHERGQYQIDGKIRDYRPAFGKHAAQHGIIRAECQEKASSQVIGVVRERRHLDC
jgi:hypothetical protein